MNVHVAVLKDGTRVGTATMQLYWMIPANPNEAPHYMINVYVLTTSTEDIYFIGYAFNTADDGWIQAMEDTGIPFSSTDVLEVAFEVKALPLMGVLWGGMWIMAVGITMVVSMGYLQKKRKAVPDDKVKEEEAEAEEPEPEIKDKKEEKGELDEETVERTEDEREERLKSEDDYEKLFEEEIARMEDKE